MILFLLKKLLFVISVIILFTQPALGQYNTNLGMQLQVPGTKNINGSETHLYVLSESEGLVVFRAYSDSLQWLYSSTGMQERGHILQSDIRFAYLYGDSRRLTVIEPTSVLGVYSSTILPSRPLSVKRIGLRLFIALGDTGLGILSLETPESVDTDVEFIPDISGVIDIETDGRRTLYALKRNNEISIFEITEDAVTLRENLQINRQLNRLFLANNELIGADPNGNIYLINSDGNTRTLAQVSAPVERLSIWNNQLVVRTDEQEVWIGPFTGDLNRWKTDARGGNYFTVSEGNLWISEFNILAPVVQLTGSAARQGIAGSQSGDLKLRRISDVTIPSGRPLILPIEFENDVDISQVALSYSAPFNNARIRGNTFFWQPAGSITGRQAVTITATASDGRSDNITFHIDIRPFNAPPRFTPSRPVSIPVGEKFELMITAVDPDGIDQNLIRYLGVDMPDGAEINERTGEFTWTPHIRQVGSHRFQIIATDQFGAASSQNFTINVIEIDEG
jgi:hypothetical protein